MGALTSPASWFIGDLDDPWVVEIADTMPANTFRFSLHTEPRTTLQDFGPPRVVVVHRSVLSQADPPRLSRIRSVCDPPPRLILLVGAHVRHDDLARCERLVDFVIHESIAREVLSNRLAASNPDEGPIRPEGSRTAISVISANFDLRQALAHTCRAAGYATKTAFDETEGERRSITIWDVPLLEPSWTAAGASLVEQSAVIALLPFPDRTVVRTARKLGIAACLESPCERIDLIHCLDRISTTCLGYSKPHEVPPAPILKRRLAGRETLKESDGESRSLS